MLIRLLLLITLMVPSMTGATVFWTEDFENHLTPNWDTAACGGSPQDGCNAAISTDMAVGGTHSLKSNYPSSNNLFLQQAGTSIKRTYPATRDTWVTFWYRTVAFQYGRDVTKHFILRGVYFVNLFANRAMGVGVVTDGIAQITCPNGNVDVACNYFANVSYVPFDDNRWYCVEGHVRGSVPKFALNGQIEIYIDGARTLNFDNIGVADSTTQTNTLDWYTQYGWGQKYIDNLVVSDVRQATCGGTPPPSDTIPPSPVTGATAAAASATSILIGHAASTDASGIAGYDYQRCQGAACTNFSPVGSNASLSFTDTGLSASTLYRYYVTARDASGNISAPSAIAEATTLADTPTAIAYVSSTLSSDNQSTSAVTFNVTTPGGNDRLMVACLMARDAVASDLSATSVTYNNLPLTKVRADDANWGGAAHARVEQWRLIAPPVGTYSFNAQWANVIPADYAVAGVSIYTGVDQLTPVEADAGASGTSTTPSVSITTLTNHAAIVDCLDARDDTGPTVGAGQVQRIKNQFGVSEATLDWMGSSTVLDKTPAGAETMDWTQASASWITSAIALKPATTNVAPTITAATADTTGADLTFGATAPTSVRIQVTGTTSNSDTVVTTATTAGGKIGVGSDTFTRADNADPGTNWTPINNTWALATNAAQASAVNAAMVELETTPLQNNQYAQVTLSAFGGSVDAYAGVKTRATDVGDTGYMCLAARGTFAGTSLERRNVGVPTYLATESASIWSAGDELSLESDGVTHRCYKNGVKVLESTDPNLTTGFAGIWGYIAVGGTATDLRLDNFASGNLTPLDTTGRYTATWPQGASAVTFIPRDSAGIENNASGAYQTVSLSGIVPTDTTPPVISGGAPTAQLAAGTTGITESVATDERARCKRSLTDTTYALMSNEMTTVTGLTHTWDATGLANNTSYQVYVRCTDQYDAAVPLPNNPTLSSYSFTYSVAAAGGDTTRPSTVTGLSCTAVSSSQIDCTLTAATDNTAVTGYEGHLCSDAACTTSQLINPTWSTATSQSLLGLWPVTQYYIAVKAFDAAGNRSLDFSNVVAVTTLTSIDVIPPSTMTRLRTDGVYKNSVVLTWDQGTDESGSVTTLIEQSPTGCTAFVPIVSQLALSKLVVTLTANTSYCFRGKFFDGHNLSTDWSNTLTVTTGATGLPRPRVSVPFLQPRAPRN